MSLSTEDRLDLIELVNAYARHFDRGEGDLWAGLFAPEGRFVQVGAGEFAGREALSDLVRVRARETPGIRHLTTNISVQATAEGASGTAYAMVLRVMPGEAVRLRNSGLYEDEYVRTADGWRFSMRRFTSWLDPQDLDRPFSFEA